MSPCWTSRFAKKWRTLMWKSFQHVSQNSMWVSSQTSEDFCPCDELWISNPLPQHHDDIVSLVCSHSEFFYLRQRHSRIPMTGTYRIVDLMSRYPSSVRTRSKIATPQNVHAGSGTSSYMTCTWISSVVNSKGTINWIDHFDLVKCSSRRTRQERIDFNED